MIVREIKDLKISDVNLESDFVRFSEKVICKVTWIMRFVMTFALVTRLVMTDINVTIKPVTNYVIHLAIVVMNNIVQGKFCTLKNMI